MGFHYATDLFGREMAYEYEKGQKGHLEPPSLFAYPEFYWTDMGRSNVKDEILFLLSLEKRENREWTDIQSKKSQHPRFLLY